MAEPTDYLRAYNFNDGAGSTVAEVGGVDNLSILGTGGAWVTRPDPGIGAVAYSFSRAGDGRAQTMITGGNLLGGGVEYTLGVLSTLPAANTQSVLAQASIGTSFGNGFYHQPWEDGRVWSGHSTSGSFQGEVGTTKGVGGDGQLHWWVVAAEDVGSGNVRVRLYRDGVLRASGTRPATAFSSSINRFCVANIFGGGAGLGLTTQVAAVRIYGRALALEEILELGITATNTPPVASAGGNQTVNEGAAVVLDGTASVDAETPFDDLLFNWTVQNADGTGLTNTDIIDRFAPIAQFIAPTVAAPASPILRLTVTDLGGLTDTDDAQVTVEPLPPGEDQFPNVALDAQVELLLGGVWTDITEFLTEDAGIVITRGRRDWAEETEPAECRMQLMNFDGRFSSRNPFGPYYGLLGRNTQLRVRITRANHYFRFWGEVASWPQDWDPTGTLITVDITAAGIIRRLAQSSDTLQSVLRRELPQLDNLVAYWPLEDRRTSRLSSGIPDGSPLRRNTQFPWADFQAFDEFDASAPILRLNDSEWRGDVNGYSLTGLARIQVGFLLAIGDGGAPTGQTILQIETSAPTYTRWEIGYVTTNNGSLRLRAVNDNTSPETELLNTGALQGDLNGRPVRVAVRLVKRESGGPIVWTVHVMTPGDLVGEELSGTTSGGPSLGRAEQIIVNWAGGHADTALGHITVQSQADDFVAYAEQLAAYDNEAAARRIERLCLENDIPFTIIGNADRTERMGPMRVDNLLALLRDCAEADRGMLFEARDRFALGYRTLETLYDQTPRVAFGYYDQTLSPPLKPVEDDQGVVNDVTATDPREGSARVVLTEGPLNVNPSSHPTNPGIGRYQHQLEANVQGGRLASHASWFIHVSAVDEPRWPNVSVELSNPKIVEDTLLTHDILSLEVGDRLVIGDIPMWLPPDDVTQLVQGYTETIHKYRHRIDWNCTPESPYHVGVYAAGPNVPFVGVGAVSSGTGNTTPGLPSGWREDDLLLLLVESAAGDPVPAMAGWVDVPNTPVVQGSGTTGTRLTARYKFAAGDEVAPTVPDPGDHAIARIAAFRNVDRDAPFSGTPATSTTGSASTAVTIPGITTTHEQALVVSVVTSPTDVASTSQVSGWTNANLDNLLERVDNWTSAGAGGGVGMATGVKQDPGATGNTTATLGTSATQARLQFALRQSGGSENAARYDTAGSVLAAGAAVGASSLSVTTTLGPRWTTEPAEFPFTVRVAGIKVLVTAISGTGTTQTFTVDPTTVTKALPIGSDVRLGDPTYYGL